MPPRDPPRLREPPSNPLEWVVAIVFTILAILVLIAALFVLLVFLVFQPKLPYISIPSAHLNNLVYDQSGMLSTEMALTVVADNDNPKTDASFSDLQLSLKFNDILMAQLRAAPFVVPKNSTLPLGYLVRSSGIPLDDRSMGVMYAALRNGRVPFDVAGQARTRWRVGIFVSVKLWTHLACQLQFHWPNGTTVNSNCTAKSH